MKMRPIHQAQRYLASPVTDRVFYTAAGAGMPRLATVCNQTPGASLLLRRRPAHSPQSGLRLLCSSTCTTAFFFRATAGLPGVNARRLLATRPREGAKPDVAHKQAAKPTAPGAQKPNKQHQQQPSSQNRKQRQQQQQPSQNKKQQQQQPPQQPLTQNKTQHRNPVSVGSRNSAKGQKDNRPKSGPASAAAEANTGAPDPLLEKEIRNIRAESNLMEKRAKLFRLVEKLGRRGRQSYKIQLIDMRFFTWIIGILGEQGMLKQALLVLEKLKAAKVKPDAILYNLLINSCAKMNRPKQALQLFEEMKVQGVASDHRTLSAVMNVFSRIGDMDRIKALKREMEAKGQRLDSYNYGCIMKAFGQNGRIDDMLSLWDEIQQKEKAKQLSVDAYLYTITIDNLGRNGMVKEMLKLWHEMKDRSRQEEGRKLRPDVVSYTTLLHNLGQNGDIEGMMTIFEEMKRNAAMEDERLKEEKQKRKLNMEIEPLKETTPTLQLWPNEQTYTCIFNHLGKVGDVGRLNKIYNELKRDSSFKLNVQVCTALINGFGRVGDLARMQKVLDKMRQEEIRPTVQTYTVLIEAFTRHGSVHGVLDMWRQAKHQNVLPDSRLFHSVVKGLPAERLPELMDVFWYIKTQQQRPTPYVYARVIDALKDAKRDNEMERVVVELEKDKVEPDRATCLAIADMWERRGHAHDAERASWVERAKDAREFPSAPE